MSYSQIRGVVFDLDATLVDLCEHVNWVGAQQELIEVYLSMGCPKEEIDKSMEKGLSSFISHEIHVTLPSLLNEDLVEDVKKRIWEILDKYELEGANRCGLIKGSRPVLTFLKEHGIKMGVCTSNSQNVAEKVLINLKIIDFFSSIIGRTTGLRMKPNPDQLLRCFLELGIHPSKGVMVGDSHNDVIAGKLAGARTVAIPVYFTKIEALNEAAPDLIINSIDELPEALLSLH